jgi:hypothetical protein
LTAGEAKNVDNAVVLARLFNEASGQKAPSKKHGLFISRPLVAPSKYTCNRVGPFSLLPYPILHPSTSLRGRLRLRAQLLQ